MTKYDAAMIIPFYNAFRGDPDNAWFVKSIESALASQHGNFAVVLIDDGSTDDSEGLAAWFAKTYNQIVHLVTLERNCGVTHALNCGIDYIDAEFIATQGSDDLSHPSRLAAQQRALMDDDRLKIVGSHYDNIAEDGTVIEPCEHISGEPVDAYVNLISGICQIGSPMFRKSHWQELGGFDEANFPRCAEDFKFFLDTAVRYPDGICVLQQNLYSYRRTPGSLTSNPYWPEYYRALNLNREERKNTNHDKRSRYYRAVV